MTLQIDLPADVNARLEAKAEGLGIAPAEYAKKLIIEHLPPAVPVPANGSLAELFAKWDAEDATNDPAEIEKRNREFEELKQAMNRNRLEMEGPNARKVWP